MLNRLMDALDDLLAAVRHLIARAADGEPRAVVLALGFLIVTIAIFVRLLRFKAHP